jgi:signal transduction histidine kinase
VSVADTGCGIAPDFLPRIWDRFARAPGAREAGRAGTGLGLAIVEALAQAMGGSVGASSTVGVGTTIWVDLQQAGEELSPP